MFFCKNTQILSLENLLSRYQIQINRIKEGAPIPGSWFGEPEAGIIGNQLYIRDDTPIHSALHESCHYICMDAKRRENLNTNAAGDYSEENGVCYLQILLADYLEGMGRTAMLLDMDSWGYSFRLGSAQRWFEEDAEDAHDWLLQYELIDITGKPTWKLRK